MDMKIEMPVQKGLVGTVGQESLKEVGDVFSSGVNVYRAIAVGGLEVASYIYRKLVKPYALPIAGIAATGGVGAAGYAFLGMSGLLTVGATAATIGGGTVAAVAATGVGVKVFGWIKEGYHYAGEVLENRIKDAKRFVEAGKEIKNVCMHHKVERAIERCEQRVTTSECLILTDTLKILNAIKAKNNHNTDLSAAINEVIQHGWVQ